MEFLSYLISGISLGSVYALKNAKTDLSGGFFEHLKLCVIHFFLHKSKFLYNYII